MPGAHGKIAKQAVFIVNVDVDVVVVVACKKNPQQKTEKIIVKRGVESEVRGGEKRSINIDINIHTDTAKFSTLTRTRTGIWRTQLQLVCGRTGRERARGRGRESFAFYYHTPLGISRCLFSNWTAARQSNQKKF